MKKAFLSLIVIIITTVLLITMTSCGSKYKNIEYIDYFLTAPTIDSLNDKLGDYSSHDCENIGKIGSLSLTWYLHTYEYENVPLGKYNGSVSASFTQASAEEKNTGKSLNQSYFWIIVLEKGNQEEMFNNLTEYFDNKYNTHKDTTNTSSVKAKKEYTYEIENDEKTVSLCLLNPKMIGIIINIK